MGQLITDNASGVNWWATQVMNQPGRSYDTLGQDYYYATGKVAGQDTSGFKNWYTANIDPSFDLNKYLSTINTSDPNQKWIGGYGPHLNPDGTVTSYASPDPGSGLGDYFKTIAAFAGAAAGGGAMGAAGAAGGAEAAAGLTGSGLGVAGEGGTFAGLGAGAAGTGASTVGDFNLFDPSTWFSSGSVGNLPPVASGATDWSGSSLLSGTQNDAFLQSIGIDPASLNFTGGGSMSDLTGGVLTDSGSAASWTQGMNLPSGVQQIVQKLLQSGIQPSALGGILSGLGINPSGILGSGLSLAAREAPGLMALDYAKNQGDGMKSIIDQLSGNQNAVVKAATDPLQANIAAGYGDLLQSQAQRGIRGSSFGDTSIANYLSTTGNSLENAGANAMEGSLALQGNLANIAQTTKNNLYGKAFDILGRGLNPGGWGNTLSLAGGN